MPISRLKQNLYLATFGYLILPYLVFFGGWARLPVAAILILILLTGTWAAACIIRQRNPVDPGDTDMLSLRDVLIYLSPVFVIALIAGVGGWGFQYGDWAKHNAILSDLIEYSWPVVYDINGEKLLLTYYTAYQLPAALVGKVFGWSAANHFLFFYTLIGFCLCALWIRVLTQVRWWWLLILFLGFSGMDVFGQLISIASRASSFSDIVYSVKDVAFKAQHLEWWGGWGFAQYSSIAALIFLVPNQATAGWLLTAMMLNDARQGNLRMTAIYYLALCSLWTPFVAIGLLPLVAFLLLFELKNEGLNWKAFRLQGTMVTVTGLVTGLMVAIYLYGRFQPFVMPLDMSGIIYDEKITFTFWRSPDMFVLRYVLFVLLEFALLHALLYWYLYIEWKPKFKPLLTLLLYSSAFLLLLPFLNWGWNNEPSMRSSIPTLFITLLITCVVLADSRKTTNSLWIKRGIVLLLLAGGLNSTFEIGRQVVHIAIRGDLIEVAEQNKIESIFEIQERQYKKYHNFVGQYVGSPDSYYMKYLAPQP